MQLDNEEQREVLLALIDNAAFPGHAAEFIANMKAAIRTASIAAPNPANDSAPADDSSVAAKVGITPLPF